MNEENKEVSLTMLWSEINLLRFKNEGHLKMREVMEKEISDLKEKLKGLAANGDE